ncbi:conserved hypothetical protein [Ricinus communis]|uniref:Secreted protein n=1 Tax=Ricinus communis TaxID=3988 RepID=B9RPD9_RICCO|nr:conserved hypothetical protein [Ricinus communis]
MFFTFFFIIVDFSLLPFFFPPATTHYNHLASPAILSPGYRGLRHLQGRANHCVPSKETTTMCLQLELLPLTCMTSPPCRSISFIRLTLALHLSPSIKH